MTATDGPAGGGRCLPGQEEEINDVRKSILIGLALRRHGSLLFSDSP